MSAHDDAEARATLLVRLEASAGRVLALAEARERVRRAVELRAAATAAEQVYEAARAAWLKASERERRAYAAEKKAYAASQAAADAGMAAWNAWSALPDHDCAAVLADLGVAPRGYAPIGQSRAVADSVSDRLADSAENPSDGAGALSDTAARGPQGARS